MYLNKLVQLSALLSEFLELHAMIFFNILPLYWYR